MVSDSPAMIEDLGRVHILLGRHVARLLEQRHVDHGCGVAHCAGVAVPIPGAPEVTALFDDPDIGDSGLLQRSTGGQPREAAADKGKFNLVGQGIPWRRLNVGILEIVGVPPRGLDVLIVSVWSEALVTLGSVLLPDGGGIHGASIASALGFAELPGLLESSDVQDGITAVDERVLELPDQHAGGRRLQPGERFAVRVAQDPDLLTLLDVSTKREAAVDDAAAGSSDPPTRSGDAGRWCRWHEFVDHTQRMEHTKDAIGTDRDRLLIEAIGLATLEQQAGCPLRNGCSPQRTIPNSRVNGDRCPEEVRQVEGALVIEITTELRMIRPVIRARVEIDAQLTTAHDFGHEQVGDTTRQRPTRRARERTIEIATVR